MTSRAVASRRSVSNDGLRDPASKWATELGGSFARSASSLCFSSLSSRAAFRRCENRSEGAGFLILGEFDMLDLTPISDWGTYLVRHLCHGEIDMASGRAKKCRDSISITATSSASRRRR